MESRGGCQSHKFKKAMSYNEVPTKKKISPLLSNPNMCERDRMKMGYSGCLAYHVLIVGLVRCCRSFSLFIQNATGLTGCIPPRSEHCSSALHQSPLCAPDRGKDSHRSAWYHRPPHADIWRLFVFILHFVFVPVGSNES